MKIKRLIGVVAILAILVAAVVAVAPPVEAECCGGGGGFWATYSPGDPLGCSDEAYDCFVIIVNG